MQKNKIMAIAVLTCAFSGFGIGLLDVQQEAEAALLPNPPVEPIVQEVLVAEPQEPVKLYTEADVEMLARLIWVEARGVESKTEQAAVVWCVLNRLYNPDRLENSIAEVVCAPYQFDYRPWAPVTDEFKALAARMFWNAGRRKKRVQKMLGGCCLLNISILRVGAAATGSAPSGSRRNIGTGGWPALMRIE